MKLDFTNQRLLAVVAHPDDAEILCAGTLARAREDGAAVAICVMCKGDKGQPARPITNLAAVRKKEMTAAARLLGAQTFFIGAGDGELFDTTTNRRKLIEVYRRFRPTLVLGHDPNDYHADHRAASQLAEAATWFCASKGHKTAGSPLPRPPALWWMDTINMTGFEPGFYIDVSAHLDLKLSMLRCHKSQVVRSKDRDLPPLAELLERQARTRGAQSDVTAAEAFRITPHMKRIRAW